MNEKEKQTVESFNEDFCLHLEFHLCRTFANSDQKELRRFWCDGVLWHPSSDARLTKKSVNDTRKIETSAWIGKTGQDNYDMTITFGRYSLRRYAKGASLIDCIPSEESMDWIDIDTKNKTIEIRLR